jgi:hypothetical protein
VASSSAVKRESNLETQVNFRKPTICEVYKFLHERNALIVHFSGTPKGAGKERGSSHLFPCDLHHVLRGLAMGGLSCSVVWPGDKFAGFDRNATGSIGVVVGFRTDQSLVAAHSGDCGSIEVSGIRIVEHERDIDLADLRKTLDLRTSYNEWVIRDYEVLGIFAATPFEVSVLEIPPYPPEMPDFLRDNVPVPNIAELTESDLIGTFTEYPIYTFGQTDIHSLREHSPICHSEIYTREACANSTS